MAGAQSSKNKATSSHTIKVLLDTNFLLLPFQRRIDIFEEIKQLVGGQVEFIVLPQILAELHQLMSTGSTKERRAAESSLILVKRHCQIITDSPLFSTALDADSALLKYAESSGAIVATNDRELRRLVVKQGNRAIFLRKLAILALTA